MGRTHEMASKHSRRFTEAAGRVDRVEARTVREAIELIKELPATKFDQTLEFAARLGVDPRKAEENVRGTITLPHGTGRDIRVAAFAKGEHATAATEAGAEVVGDDDLIAKIDEGWEDFDVLVAHVEMMRSVGRLGKKLGPRMPNKKAGTVAEDVGEAIRQIKAGKVQYRVDRQGNVHVPLGRLSFDNEKLIENFVALYGAVLSAKPSSLKGVYVRSVFLSSTMGPGVRVDVVDAREIVAAQRAA
jgi:large subunit ribosomal protein L1